MVKILYLGKPKSFSGNSEYLNVFEDKSNFLSGTKKYIDEIYQFLPRNGNVFEKNPNWLKNQIHYDFLQDISINITFICKNTIKKDSFGYFIYDTKNPPESTNDINDLIFPFPNSALNSGDTISLVSEYNIIENKEILIIEPKSFIFKKGKSIGFVLIPNGWNGSKISNTNDILFSNSKWNNNHSITTIENIENIENLKEQIYYLSLKSFIDPNLIYICLEDNIRYWVNSFYSFNSLIFGFRFKNEDYNLNELVPYDNAIKPTLKNNPPTKNYIYGYKKVYHKNKDDTISECIATLRIPEDAEIRTNIYDAQSLRHRTNKAYVESITILPRYQQRFNMHPIEENVGIYVDQGHSWVQPSFKYKSEDWVYQDYGSDEDPKNVLYGIHFFKISHLAYGFSPPK